MSCIKKFKLGNTVYDVGPNKTSELQNDAGFLTKGNETVNDVQINGTSILNNNVANISIASQNNLGVIRTNTAYGLIVDTTSGVLYGWPSTYDIYSRSSNGLIISKGTLENVLTGKGFLTENEAVTKTATGIQTIQSALFLGGLTSKVSFGNAITHQRKLSTPDPLGRTLYGAGFQVGNPSCACELITKTWDDAGANAYNTAVLRMGPSGLSFGVNGSPGTAHKVPTEAEFKKVAIADDLALIKSGGDLILKHGTTTVSTLSNAIPTKTSDITNDAGFITSASLPTKVSDLLNDSGFLTTANIATSLTPGVIKSGYQLNVASDGTTSCGTITKTSYASADNANFISKGTLDNILTDYALSSDVPVKISDLTDDSNFIEDTDYATISKGGTILLSNTYCTDIYDGALMARTISVSDLDNANGYAFVSMQTMRNQLYKYLTIERAENTLATKSSLNSAMSEMYSALNSGLNSVASIIPRNTSDLNNDNGFLSIPWYYQTEGSSVDASVKINTMITTYGKVVLGPGTYYIKNSIVLRKNEVIEGLGPQTIIKWNGTVVNDTPIVYVLSDSGNSGPERICIKNLCIKGIEDSEVATSIDFTSSTVPTTVPIGIKLYGSNEHSSTIQLDQPIVIENVIMENLSVGIADYLRSGYDTNPYLTSQQYEPTSDRLHINRCTFRNCYTGYSDELSSSYPGGGVVFNYDLFNRTRMAIMARHFGYNIVNCAFYHTYFRSFETPYEESSTLNNIPIKFTNCRFFMPAADDVAHIETQLYNSSDSTKVIIDGSFFEFGKATTMSSMHLKIETSNYIISNCRFVMRATGGSFMNYIGLYGFGSYPSRNFLINTISDTQIAPFSGEPIVLNSFTDTGGDILAE